MNTLKTFNKRKLRFWMKKVLWRHFVGVVVIAFSVFPLVWMISGAFDVTGQLSTQQLIPMHKGLANFEQLFSNSEKPFLVWARNSMVVALSAAALQVIIGALAAYSLSRHRFKGRKLTLTSILIVQMFPQLLAATTLFLIINTFGKSFVFLGLGHQLPLILIFAGSALGVNTWMLKSFFDTLPTEIDEAAKIDGASPMQTYWLIFIPLATPVLAVVCLLSFIGTFNEFIVARLFLVEMSGRTVAVGLQQFIGGQYASNWGAFAAGSILASIPIVIIFLSLQKYIVNGLTAGSVKG